MEREWKTERICGPMNENGKRMKKCLWGKRGKGKKSTITTVGRKTKNKQTKVWKDTMRKKREHGGKGVEARMRWKGNGNCVHMTKAWEGRKKPIVL